MHRLDGLLGCNNSMFISRMSLYCNGFCQEEAIDEGVNGTGPFSTCSICSITVGSVKEINGIGIEHIEVTLKKILGGIDDWAIEVVDGESRESRSIYRSNLE